ncbi:hypothetical protein HMPREF1990_00808 [Porphyromonas gingivalis W4087]|nr:hypothetical protein HMPREF1990_00808 [Porphyromonas gingivalis W4087]
MDALVESLSVSIFVTDWISLSNKPYTSPYILLSESRFGYVRFMKWPLLIYREVSRMIKREFGAKPKLSP